MSELFRKEAIAHATRRLNGAVTIALPASVKLSALVFSTAVFAALIFAANASYARKETVLGWVTPSAGLVRATPRSTGVLVEQMVREGDEVSAGQVIARVDVSAMVEAGAVGAQLAQGLQAEADTSVEARTAQVRRLFAERQTILADIAHAIVERTEAEQQVGLFEQQYALAQREVERAEAVASRGFLAQRDLETRKSSALSAASALSGARRRVVAATRQIESLNGRLQSLPAEKAAVRAAADVAIAGIAQRQTQVEGQTSQVVVSPVSGRVAATPARVGQQMEPNEAVAIIIPKGSHLVGELYIPSRAAGFIRAGQDVRLMYQAFPNQRFGAGQGMVESISRTVLSPQDVAIPGLFVVEPVFRVQVRLTRNYVETYRARLPLQPGMLLTADVVIDQRTLIEWFLDPLFAAQRAHEH